jgi:hypothetical protein
VRWSGDWPETSPRLVALSEATGDPQEFRTLTALPSPDVSGFCVLGIMRHHAMDVSSRNRKAPMCSTTI